jgi:hypothetical protein
MCQSKAQGGKRCLAHSKLSQFVVRIAKFKYKASDETIKETMHELSREGRNLPQASGQTVSAFIDKQKFATEIDPAYSSHERTILMNQLSKATDETKNGVDGSHFHVWKNFLGRIRNKMRKTVMVVGMVGVLSATLAGCTGNGGVTPSTSASPAPSTSISQSASPSPSATALGSVDLTTETVKTPDGGSYLQVELPATSPLYKYNKSIVDDDATSRFSKAEIASGQKFISDFVVTQGTNSIAVDGDKAGWAQWQKDYADQYIYASQKKAILSSATSNGSDRSSFIMNDSNNSFPPLLNNGGSRIKTEDVTLSQVSGGDSSLGKYLSVFGEAKVEYVVDKAALKAQALKDNPSKTEADLKKDYPGLFKAAPVYVKTDLTFSYSLVKDGQTWKIAGFQNSATNDYVNLK